MKKVLFYLLSATLVLSACKKEGCTDANATNYDADAKTDDGSCTYPDPGDTQKPVATIEKPANATEYAKNDTVEVHMDFTDNVALSTYTLKVSGGSWDQTLTESITGTSAHAHQKLVVSSTTAAGDYTLTATATDKAGNVSAESTVTIKVTQDVADNEKPVMQTPVVTWPLAPNPMEASTPNKVRVQVTDNMGVATIVTTLTLKSDGSEIGKTTTDATKFSDPKNINEEITIQHSPQGGVAEYDMDLKVVCTDAAGNSSEETIAVKGKF
ncbi:DUF4625 domain-containing protein [bacterium SCSIO 12741]|nr:DUF4625 domain-containing protein [bacterium SCSIO 12741]